MQRSSFWSDVMRFFFTLILSVFVSLTLGSTERVVFTEPINPTQLLMDDERIYVADFPHVFIYSKTDYSLKAKLGGDGEGPGRFQFHPGSLVNKTAAFNIDICSGQLMVSSQGKLSFYKTDGTYIRELKTSHRHDHRFSMIGDTYLGLTSRRGRDGLFYIRLNLYNSTLKPVKEIFQFKRFSQPPKGDLHVVYDQGVIYDTDSTNIFVTAVGREGSVIDVFDRSGRKMYSISHEYETPVVSEQDRLRYMDFYRAGPLKYVWERFKKQIRFPSHFPGLRDFRVNDGNIYVLTFMKSNRESEIIVFGLKGNFIRKVRIPLAENDIYLYPYCIFQGHCFQLKENPDEECWELLSWPISAGFSPKEKN
jgi:hypothetical protein